MAKPRGYRNWTPRHKSTYWANRRKVKADLLNPQKQLSGQSLMNVAKAQVGIELDPQVSALDTQARSTRIQQGALASRAGGYYKDLAESVAGNVARSQALTGTLSGKLGAIGAEGQATVDRAQGVADATRATDIGIRGEGLQGGGDERVRAELAAQRAGMASQTQASQDLASNIGGSTEGLIRSMGSVQQMRGGEVQQQLLNRMQNELSDVRTKKSDLQAKRGPAVLDQLTKLRQTAFENAMTARTLGQKQQADALDQQVKLADLALQGKKYDTTTALNNAKLGITRGQLRETKRSHLANERAKGKGGGAGGYTKSKLQGFDSAWNFAKATAGQLYTAGTYKDKKTGATRNLTPDLTYQMLLAKTKDPDIARAAAYAAFGKPIPAKLRHRLAMKGIHPGNVFSKPAVGGGPRGTGRM